MNLDTASTGIPTSRSRWWPWRSGVARPARASHSLLLRDGLSLTMSAGLTSIAGMLAWVAAARLLPRAEVGQASAFVSGFLLVAGLGDVSLGAALMRWVPRAGEHRRTLILRCYAVVLVTSLLVAIGVLILPTGDEIAETLPGFGPVLFVAAALGWALFQFQDTVLVSLGRASWVPYENASIGLARVGILVVLGPLLGTLGILLSWMVPAAIGVVVISVLIARTLARTRLPNPVSPRATRSADPWRWATWFSRPPRHEARSEHAFGTLPDRAEVLRLLGPTYPAKVCACTLTDLIPLLVVGRFGPAHGAVFFVVWMAANTVDYVVLSFAQSVIVRIAHEPARTAELFWIGCKRAILLFVPPLLLGVVIAHPVLSVFGQAYASHGTTLLRLVLIGSIPRGLITLVVAVFMAHGKGKVVALLEAGSALGVIALVAFAPGHGLTSIGLGFVAVQTVVALAAIVLLFRALPGLRAADPDRAEVAP